MKIYKLISTLTNDEILLLNDFAKSPFYNKKNAIYVYIHKVCNLIKHTADVEDFNDLHLYKQVYPKSAFNDNQMRKLRSVATILVEDFMVTLTEQKNRDRLALLMRFYQERNVWDLLEDTIKKEELFLETVIDKSSVYYGKLADVQINKIALNLEKGKFDLPLALASLDNRGKSHAIEYLKRQISLYGIKSQVDLASQTSLLTHYLNWVKNFNNTESVQLNIYYNILMLLLATSDEESSIFYKKIKYIILSTNDDINCFDLLAIISNIRNYCLEQSDKGKKEYREDAFFWSEYIVDNEKLSGALKKRMKPLVLLSYVDIALRLEKFDFTLKFINEYTPFLHSSIRYEYKVYATALLYFYQKKYIKAGEELIKADSINKGNDQIKKYYYILFIKIHYESENYDLLELYMNRLRVFDSRSQTLIKPNVIANNNFLLVVSKLLKINYLKQVSSIPFQLLEEITNLVNNTEILEEREWLIEKTQALYGFKKKLVT